MQVLKQYVSVFNYIEDLLANKRDLIVIAIDGKSGSGKSTLAKTLQDYYSCPVIFMDHFFLRPVQRNPERLQEIGGNIDYERFQLEVETKLRSGQPFTYRVYDCKQDLYSGVVEIKPHRLIIIEGCYSHHPVFTEKIDLRIFLTVNPQIQHERILQRNGSIMLKRFLQEWIPLEEHYFSNFSIAEKSDLIISTNILS